jgi:hypothetical protein
MTLIVRPDYHAVPILEKNGIRWIPPSQAMRQDGLSLGHIGNHLGHQSAVSTERYSHFSGEETLKTGASINKKLYGQIDSECIRKCIRN